MPIPKAGRSTIHSALVAGHVVTGQVCLVVKLLAVSVASVSLSVYAEPLLATEAEILSPGLSPVPTLTRPLAVEGISHQAKEMGAPREHHASVPSCSNDALLKPSRPTHSEVSWSSAWQVTLGMVHEPLTRVKVPALVVLLPSA